jgi:integrase
MSRLVVGATGRSILGFRRLPTHMPIKEGSVPGRINKGGRFIGAGMSASSIDGIVVQYAARLEVKLTPHDLRRTYGKLPHKGKARIEQFQLSCGHSSLTTTEKYLGIEQDLEDAPCDHLGLARTSSGKKNDYEPN